MTPYHYIYPDTKFYEITPSSWEDAKKLAKALPMFVFRGHSDSRWPLKTTIERATSRFNCPPEEIWDKENYILQIFKSRAHHYIQSPPKDDELIEWFSIIQDYGGPTRLLDFTESFLVASFFAMEAATDDACVWAVNNLHLFVTARTHEPIGLIGDKPYEFGYSKEIQKYAETFLVDSEKSYKMVLKVLPPRLNERLAIQKGLFLFPCNISKSFESNLCNGIGIPFDTLDSSNALPLPEFDFDSKDLTQYLKIGVLKIILPKQLHGSAIADLHSMNIDASSLFPGLDGFARSLISSIQFPKIKFTMPIPQEPKK